MIIKSNKGHAGLGLKIWRAGELSHNALNCQNEIADYLNKNQYWQKFPVVVEKLIELNPKIAGGNPNLELKIESSGKVKFLYFCGMRINRSGIFQGIEISQRILSQRLNKKLLDFAYQLGEVYSQAGYRGYFELDFLSAADGQVFLSESNIRRTGGTHTYHLQQHLMPKLKTGKETIISVNLFPVKNKTIKNFNQLLNLIKPILFNNQNGEGVIITSANLLKLKKIAYVIFAKNEKRAQKIEEKLQMLLTSNDKQLSCPKVAMR